MKLHLVAVLVLVAAMVLPLTTPHRVAACSGDGVQRTYRDIISLHYESELIPAVTLAEIANVRLISPTGARPVYSNGEPLLVKPDGTIATFKPHVLWSNTELPGNTVGPLGYVYPDCSGGPTLREGDKVLMFLSRARPPVADFSIGFGGGTILFRGDTAYHLGVADNMERAGSTEEVLSYFLSIAKSPETTTAPAREFLGLPPAN